MQTYTAILSGKTTCTESVVLFRFNLLSSSFDFIPGQYVILSIPSPEGVLKRLYSVASPSSEKNSIELLIKLIPGGKSSSYLESLRIGAPLEFQGPAGVFSLKKTAREKVFFATGTGLAPIRSFLLSNALPSSPYRLFWGVQTRRDVYLEDELISLARNNPLFRLRICLSKEVSLEVVEPEKRTFFRLGRINTAWENEGFSATEGCEYYICGKREMVESVREYLYNRKIDRELVYFERY